MPGQKHIIVPLGITTEKSEITFSTKHQNLGNNTVLYLEDKLNNTLVDITNTSYVLEFKGSENNLDRFYLHIKYQEALGLNDNSSNQIKIYASNKTLFVRRVKEETSLEIINLLGQKVFKSNIKSDEDINLSGILKTGVFLVNLKSNHFSKTQKIILK